MGTRHEQIGLRAEVAVAQIERENESPAYVIEADGDRVMVPEVEGADMDVGDDVEISRDQQGNYEADTDYGYGR